MRQNRRWPPKQGVGYLHIREAIEAHLEDLELVQPLKGQLAQR